MAGVRQTARDHYELHSIKMKPGCSEQLFEVIENITMFVNTWLLGEVIIEKSVISEYEFLRDISEVSFEEGKHLVYSNKFLQQKD